MKLECYFSKNEEAISVSAEQASQFAKVECQDFNPIHDPDNKRFCVPGDLLFSIALHKYGVSKSMTFSFTGMVGADMGLNFPASDKNVITISNAKDKSVMEIERSGESEHSKAFIDGLISKYVLFSGQNFPSLLMPLMKEHNVMFNTARPLVMYNSMSLEFETFEIEGNLDLVLSKAKMEPEPKRATSFIYFDILDTANGNVIGKGVKKSVLAGLKVYDHQLITDFANAYEARRGSF
jgi:hypothetical protein